MPILTMSLISVLPWITFRLYLILTLNSSSSKAQVTITTQPSDVAVPSGGTAVFTCVVVLADENANTDDIKWDNMGKAITRVSTDPYMVENDFEEGDQLISTLTIKNVNKQHAGLYQFVVRLNDGDVMSREASLIILTAKITTQPRDVIVCNGGVAMLTCVVDRNGTDITSDDVMWQMIRMSGGISTLSIRVPFNITTTISGDTLTSTLTITGVTDSNVLGTSLYRCVVNDMMSRKASLYISTVTTQPSDIAVESGETVVFTCVVDVGRLTVTTDDVKWDNMGNAITRVSTDPYMVNNDFETIGQDMQLNSTLTIKNVNTQHAGLYQFVLSLNDGDVMSREASLIVLAATITTQPSDVTVCTGGSMGIAMFTCVVDRNGTDTTSDNLMWEQIRVGGTTSTLSTSLTGGVPFNITTTISGDILTSTLTITGVTDSNPLGTSSYRCVVNDMMSRDASPLISADTTGPPGTPINIRVSEISSTSFVVQWDEVDDVDYYIVSWRDDGGSVSESTTLLISTIITQLTPNTTYNVTVTAGNICGSGRVSDILIVTTNVTLLVGPSITTLSLVTSSTMMLLTASTSSAPCVYMPTQSQSDSSSLSTGVAVAVTFTITFIITLTVSVVITFLVTFVIVKRKFEKIYKTTHQPTQQMPLYETVITPAITKSDVKLEANPAYGTSDRVAMNDNPAYLSCK